MTDPTTAEPAPSDVERAARLFHETYEELAPSFSYETRKASAVPWEQVPEQNRALMVATVARVLATLNTDKAAPSGVAERLERIIEAAEVTTKPMVFIGTQRREEHYALRFALASIKDLAKEALATLHPNKAVSAAGESEAVVEVLLTALEPFAKAADIKLCGEWRDDERFAQTDVGFHLTFGDLRQARAAVTALREQSAQSAHSDVTEERK